MSTNILPLQKKLRVAFFSLIFSGSLIYLSQNLNLNEKTQRFLAKSLDVPQQFITQVLNEYQEFENQKIAQLEDEILNLQNQIYEYELEIRSLENSGSYDNLDFFINENSATYINSFDQTNFTCCKKHRVYINNPNKLQDGIYAISQGGFALGKTKNISNNEIEVRLLSDPDEYISVKTTTGFFCIAKGTGKGRIIGCLNESKAVSYELGDTFFTTGFDGIYPPDLIVGKIVKISTNQSNIFQHSLEIELFFDPYKSINKKVIVHE
jgi:cell shape-determining protein MreC